MSRVSWAAAACGLLAVLLVLLPGLARAECINMVSGAGGPAFWRQVQLGAQAAAQQNRLQLYFRGPQSERDPQMQLQVVDKVLERPCAALIIAPSGDELLGRLSRLRQSGLITLFIDRDIGSSDVAAAVVSDNFQAGVVAGQHMVRLLKGRGRVAVLRPASRAQSITQRVRGFVQSTSAGGLRVVFEQRLSASEGGDQSNLALQLQALDGLFTANESTSLITLGALRRAKLAGQLVHIGFDANPQLVEALRSGEMAGLLVQQPYQMGYQSVELALRHLRGEPDAPRTIGLAAVWVEPQGLDNADVQNLLYP